MSTFKGIVEEFPQIRIDYFRHQPDYKPPLACFLSHVHSDHLLGLESFRAPFVYCSAATREILLRIEKYYHRVNFARGILESRTVTYAKHMGKLAKPLPLETPTEIEISPGNRIRVTLFDANHCVGAVMFLIEGEDKAILYTGDIRAETWWVNSLVQNPVVLPYALGIRTLDCIYLDTTFATKSEPYREFPSKAEGIRELLEKVSKYSKDTLFYFHSWTFGYENVWIALSTFLGSQIHVDEYRARIYESLSPLKNDKLRGVDIREAPALCGFKNGNHSQPGCLTSKEDVRLHSCERGMGCSVVDAETDAEVVHIIPIVTRTNGTEIAEVGAGGGKGDLDQTDELETGGVGDVGKLMELCASKIEDQELLSRVLSFLQKALDQGNDKIELGMDIQKESQGNDDNLSLHTLISILAAHVNETKQAKERQNETIRFPYSRHSSYSELCTLVEAFKPRDVYPCTVDEGKWTPVLGIRNLFGQFCSSDAFRHDTEMMEAFESRQQRKHANKHDRGYSQEGTQSSHESMPDNPSTPKRYRVELGNECVGKDTSANPPATPVDSPDESRYATPIGAPPIGIHSTNPRQSQTGIARTATINQAGRDIITPDSPPRPEPARIPPSEIQTPSKSHRRSSHRSSGSTTGYRSSKKSRDIAYEAALGTTLTWADLGGLVSTRKRSEEREL
ncbi:beta-lactamase-like protein [Clohesyomyces aquaticus]|uniref:Protein artemis n=1 Tax=Clohesyomyces aquaticus TaxID=1231657 RepID=A0A1Y1ZQ89_9PLEO|nr:beta-lactamase-like protein [Clohesyomyces aquaticus]